MAAAANGPLVVAGAGYSVLSGQMSINARSTGPAAANGVYPAVGFIHAPSSFWIGDMSGTVTCIARGGLVVGGTLDTPLPYPFGFYTNFVFLFGWAGDQQWAQLLPSLVSPDCGSSVYDRPGTPRLPDDLLQSGHFVIAGNS
jgi:hypothetical protein